MSTHGASIPDPGAFLSPPLVLPPDMRLSLDRIALFVDADGTLLDITIRPDETIAPPGLVDTLDIASRVLGGALAIVSGRRIEDIDRIFLPLRLPASGVHGAQMRSARDAPIVDRGSPDIPQQLANEARAVATRFPGALVEDKREAVAIHWRACPEFENDIHAELTQLLQAAAPTDLIILRGHCVFEIKSAATSKGAAVRTFMLLEPFAGRRPVFIGDDVTDMAGFAAAKELGGHGFAVRARLPGSDGMFPTPHDVRTWLGSLANGEFADAPR